MPCARTIPSFAMRPGVTVAEVDGAYPAEWLEERVRGVKQTHKIDLEATTHLACITEVSMSDWSKVG